MSEVKPHLIAREKWLTALESGEHVQCRGQLKSCYPDQDLQMQPNYCALGLSAHLVNPEFHLYDINRSIAVYGFTRDAVSLIVSLNDQHCLTFKEIASQVRANPNKFFMKD